MYVAITGSGKARVIQFREDKRNPGTNKKVTAVIKTIGNYERMLAKRVFREPPARSLRATGALLESHPTRRVRATSFEVAPMVKLRNS